ncbi:Uncharacterised protein [Legionella lansingensis]|uniref:Transmembrane protein n=1 Tax=Legionella lansingensis TaxID=45067 RepID=A0A0W0VU88_9GAMM|nr:hypothetical protein [Legionella lansingensis]KTD23618.1 hypothetical protein Llan_0753 [Legionella lansingensis]SNV52428.1 Uncharacterised protein [Legionella lansingensis]
MTANTKPQTSMNPRFAGAVFFAIFALLFLLFTKYTLLSLRDSALVPLLPALLFSLVTGLLLGALFGNALAKKGSLIRPFILGVVLACIVLILLGFIVFAHYSLTDASLIQRFQHWQDYFIFYGAIFVALLLTVGIWLIPFTGLVAIYFNKRFWPGLASADQKRQSKKTDIDLPDE